MKKNSNAKPILLTLIVILSIILGNILLNLRFFGAGEAMAAIVSGTERTANNTTTSRQYASGIANDAAGNFVVAWSSLNQDGSGNGIYFRRFDSEGTALDAADQLVNDTTNSNQSDPSVAMDKNGNFVIAWAGNGEQLGHEDAQGIFVKAFDSSGAARGSEIRVNTTTANSQFLPDIAIDYDNASSSGIFAVTWYSCDATCTDTDTYVQRYSVDFTVNASPAPQGSETPVNSYTTGQQNESSIGMNTTGEFIVSWWGEGSAPAGTHVWYQAYDNAGAAVGTNTKVNSSSLTSAARPSAAADKKTRSASGGNFVIAYDGVSADDADGGIFARQIQCSGGSCSLHPVEIRVNSTTAGTQWFADVASDYLGNFTIAWWDDDNDAGDTNGDDIFAQSFAYNDGQPYGQLARIGSEFQINTTSAGDQNDPSVTINADGQYVVSFSNGTTPNEDVSYQQYVSDLLKVDTEILTHTANSGVTQHTTDVAVAPNGNHAAVWVENNNIYFTLWDADNAVILQGIQVDTTAAANDQDSPSISFFKDTQGTDQGRFIIAFEGSKPDCSAETSSGLDVWYREVNADGTFVNACETRANAITTGNQTNPDIAAGYYNNDGGAAEDIFVLIYKNQISTLESAYHSDAAFTENTIEPGCFSTMCLRPAVSIDPALGNLIVYAWDDDDGAGSGVFIRQSSADTLVGNVVRVNASTTNEQTSADVAFLPNGRFIVTYTESDSGVTFADVLAKRYQFNMGGDPAVIDNTFTVSNFADITGPQVYSRVSGDSTAGDFIIVWTDQPNVLEDNQIYGQLYEYQSDAAGGLVTFGPNFRINSTQSGSQSLPSVGMNDSGDIYVTWEGNVNQPGNVDTNGVAIQGLYSPLFTEPFPELQPQALQQISGGGRTLTVPANITFPGAGVNTTAATQVQVSIRDVTNGGAPEKYIEVTDLDGAAFTISAVINDPFQIPGDTTGYITEADVLVRNWDQSTTDTDADCAGVPSECVQTINTSSGGDSSFDLPATTSDFIYASEGGPITNSLDTQRVLVDKSSNSEIGQWRFYPEFRMNIPARTPPGNHTTEMIFSLT